MTDHSLLERVRRAARGVAPPEERARRIADLTCLGKDDQALFDASPPRAPTSTPRRAVHGHRRMRLPDNAHTRDFRLEDAWALPTPGSADDFPRLVRLLASDDPSQHSSRAADALWAIRWKVGKLLGWDGPDAGLGSRVPTLRDRLPEDLRDAASGPPALPFTSLYLIDDEWAAEIANRTMHGVMHIGWVPDGTGGYRGQMAVLVKPNGLLGIAYMAAIRPFRHLIVYPALIRQTGRAWQALAAGPSTSAHVPHTAGN
jgi:hypothetical protein